jgi:hypothetical protein
MCEVLFSLQLYSLFNERAQASLAYTTKIFTTLSAHSMSTRLTLTQKRPSHPYQIRIHPDARQNANTRLKVTLNSHLIIFKPRNLQVSPRRLGLVKIAIPPRLAPLHCFSLTSMLSPLSTLTDPLPRPRPSQHRARLLCLVIRLSMKNASRFSLLLSRDLRAFLRLISFLSNRGLEDSVSTLTYVHNPGISPH